MIRRLRRWLSDGGGRAGWLRRVALVGNPSVMQLLVAQGEVSVRALEAFEAWSAGGGEESARRVRDLEHEADDARRRLVVALRDALATPVGQEDLYTLSERLDGVVNRVKNIVREAEALDWAPDEDAKSMAADLHAGMVSVVAGLSDLTGTGRDAADAATATVRHVRSVEHRYRRAMASKARGDDPRALFTAWEMYRFYVETAEALEGLGHRLWYVVLAEP